MIKCLGKIPEQVILACSGGKDSMAALDFITNSNRKVYVAHFNHGTPQANEFQAFVEKECQKRKIEFSVGKIERERKTGESKEDYWRNERYRFFKETSVFRNAKMITCHHLDDVVETWIWSALNGNPKLIPYKRDFIIRPFLTTTKDDLSWWAEKNKVDFIEDLSNSNVNITRNRIRHNIVPEASIINPGLRKVIKKKIIKEYDLYAKTLES